MAGFKVITEGYPFEGKRACHRQCFSLKLANNCRETVVALDPDRRRGMLRSGESRYKVTSCIMGFGSAVARSTLADANESRDWRIFADFAQVLIRTAIKLYAKDSTGVAEVRDLYALDSTTIDLCLALFPWAKFRKHKAAVKLHTLLDLRGSIPTFIRITDGKVHDVNILDEVAIEAGAFYVMDRGYIDFERLYRFTLSSAFFVVRTKANILLQRRYSHPVDRSTGLRSDHTVILTAMASVQAYPDPLRRVTYCDPETGKRLKFLTNNFTLPPLIIAEIYKKRWAVELFFRWIKMHLRIKAFYGTSPNAVKTPNLDRRGHLCAGGHRPQTPRHRSQPLPTSTDFQCYPLRENPHFTGTSAGRFH